MIFSKNFLRRNIILYDDNSQHHILNHYIRWLTLLFDPQSYHIHTKSVSYLVKYVNVIDNFTRKKLN